MTTRANRSIFIALIVCLVLTVLALTRLPLIPSADGPVHLYYAGVARTLVEGHSPYAGYYRLKPVLPPYLFHYAFLGLLEEWLDPLLAEKLLVAAYIVGAVLALVYLSGALQSSSPSLAGLVTLPLILNLTVFLGFLNFDLACAMAFALMGYWLRYWNSMTTGRYILFALLFFLMASMHPVPVLLFVLFVFVHALFVSFPAVRSRGLGQAAISALRQVVFPCLCCIPIALWVAAITLGKPASRQLTGGPGFVGRFEEAILMWTVTPLATRSYRYEVLILCAAVVAVAWIVTGRRSLTTGAVSVLSTSALCLIAYFAAPQSTAGSGLFPIRFLTFGILLLLAVSSALIARSGPLTIAIASVAVVANVTLLFQLSGALNGTAREIDQDVRALPRLREGAAGVLVAFGKPEDADYCHGCGFATLDSAGVHYFRVTRSVMMNGLWVTLPIGVLDTRVRHVWDDCGPREMGRLLLSDSASQPPFEFIIVEGSPASPAIRAGVAALTSRYHLTLVPSRTEYLQLFVKAGAHVPGGA